MHVADVVDDHAESEGALVGLVRELAGDLAGVSGLRGADLALKELGEGIESLDDINIRLAETEVIKSGAWLVEVGLVDEVPVALEGVALALDVIGEGGALGEGVVALSAEVGVVLLEDSELGKSISENVGVVGLEERLGLSCDC